jgi:hypothetical protein
MKGPGTRTHEAQQSCATLHLPPNFVLDVTVYDKGEARASHAHQQVRHLRQCLELIFVLIEVGFSSSSSDCSFSSPPLATSAGTQVFACFLQWAAE